LFSRTSARPFDFERFREKMKTQGLNSEQLRFQSSFSRLESGEKSIMIYVSYGGAPAGYLDMVYSPKEGVFQSHSFLNEPFRGAGMGMMLYVLAAKIAYERYRSKFTSSIAPEVDASIIWEWAKRNQWTEMNRKLGRPQFILSIVAGNFGELYSFFLAKTDGELPSSALIR
jgi:hypothetical protein